jgi:hypothetical protein
MSHLSFYEINFCLGTFPRISCILSFCCIMSSIIGTHTYANKYMYLKMLIVYAVCLILAAKFSMLYKSIVSCSSWFEIVSAISFV